MATPEHPFYVVSKGWIKAGALRPGDVLSLQSGDIAVVGEIWLERLAAPTKVYNFEVEGFHTYYVGDSAVLVHNSCGMPNTPDQDALIQLAKDAEKTGLSIDDANVMWSWAEETGLSSLKNFHPPMFDRFMGGTQLHIKINGMHIKVY